MASEVNKIACGYNFEEEEYILVKYYFSKKQNKKPKFFSN